MSEKATSGPLIDVTHLEISSPGRADPGAILIQAGKSPMYAAWLIIGGGGPRNALVIDNGKYGFKVFDASQANGVFMRVKNPRFVVDTDSGITGMDGSPEKGTLFVTSDGAGILAGLDHGECRVMLDGTISDHSSYSEFAGFPHWRIEVDGPGDQPRTLFTYRDQSLDKDD